MRLVGITGGALATAVFTVAVAACAEGSAFIDPDEAGFDAEAGAPDGSVIPSKDSGTTPTDSGPDSEDDSGSCTKKVVLNEIRSDGTTGSDELVEIYNPNTCAVPMGGWKIAYRSSGDGLGPPLYTFPAGASIAAKSFQLFAPNGAFPKIDGTLNPGMAAAAGQVGLLDDTDKLVDGVAYGAVTGGTFREKTPAPVPPKGGSIGRKVDGVDTDDGAADWKSMASSTPGVAN